MTPQKPQPSTEEVERWLEERHDGAVEDLAPLAGGFWSSAYAYRVGSEDFVLRISQMQEGFAIDARATKFTGPSLPVPEVIERGRAFDLHFAVSRRHYGRFLEDTPLGETAPVAKALVSLLGALRAVPSAPSDPVAWHGTDSAGPTTWRGWLRAGLVDDASAHVHGWRAKLASDPRLDDLFRRCETRIEELLPACAERRDLVHGDLLHQNVLIADDDASRVTAVFSWKCSVRGDFLFDVAWCTFWGPWHPAIEAADMWHRTLEAEDLCMDDLQEAALRHHCYELQIGASHLGWNAWTGDDRALEEVARATERTLARGPREA